MVRGLDLTRELVDRLPARVDDPGPIAGEVAPPGYYAATVREMISKSEGQKAVWVFAFGSLMWKRPFAEAETRSATIRGWHRSFCLGPDTRYRGNPDAPGMMLSLDRGGQCKGKVLRLNDERVAEDLDALLRSEPPVPPRPVRAETPAGPVLAFAFVCPRSFFGYCGGLTDDETAARIARAVGMLGSMPDYLHNSVIQLEAMGIHDRYLWRMQKLVAEQMRRLPR